MRFLLYVAGLLCLLAARPAYAQLASLAAAGTASARSARPSASQGPVPDTAAALHRLFARHRARRRRLAIGTLAVGTALTIIPAVSVKRANDPLEAGFNGLGAILAGTLTGTLVPLELLYGRRFSRRDERQAIGQWRAHQLPTELRQLLKPAYFLTRQP